MKLSEAIELAETVVGYTEDDEPQGYYYALKLLIEAGKRLIWARGNLIWRDDMLLPGESKE